MKRHFCWIAFWILLVLPSLVMAQPGILTKLPTDQADFKNTPLYLEADTMQYDQNLGVMIAKGQVQIYQQGRYVLADTISYNEHDNTVIASGNIVMHNQSGGETVYADFVELKDDMKNGVIHNLRLRLNDNSRLAAQTASRTNGGYKNMRHAVFSPCEPCKNNPQRAPLWQLKAEKITHDESAQEIQYDNARLELYGVPIFYSPYLSHPDPNLKRRSGLLAPYIANSQELGVVLRQPYYYTFNPSQDLVVEPIVMTHDGFILNNHYRQRFDSGDLDIKASGGLVDKRTRTDTNSTARGNIDAKLNLDLDDNWRAQLAVDRASDKTYLRRYKFSGDDVLISTAMAEGFFDRNYAQIRALSFQGLRDFDKGRTTPYILPQLRYSYSSDYDNYGGLWKMNGDLLNLQRQDGTDSNRAVLDGEWRKPMRTENGQLVDVVLRTQAIGYHINDYDDPTTAAGETQEGWRGRATPQANISWRYPLAGIMTWNDREKLTKYIEPVISAVAAPNVGNNSRIPNEDSQAFEFDESNLFSLKRFPGYDRVAGGHRIDYGVNFGLFDDRSRGGKVFVGQSWRARNDSTYAPGSGLTKDFSDVVGKIEVNPSDRLDLVYRFRVDPENHAFRRSEFSANTQVGALKLGLDYLFLDRLAGSNEFSDRKELGARASIPLSDQWTMASRIVTDLNTTTGTRLWGTGFTYHDECFSIGLGVERDFISDGENKPGTSFIFRIDLKHLGGELQNDYFTPKRANVYTGSLLPQN